MDFPKSVPSVGLVDGKFVDEDVVAGTPGSLIPAQWGNAVTEEVLSVIESAGLTPDENNNAQLLAAVNVKIAAAIPGSPPDASTTEKGLVELATSLETQTGTDALRAVTPAALTARTATDTRTGVVELATSTETQTGTDAVRAVTPAGLASLTATATRSGLVELATDVETQTGTDTLRAITPAGLASLTATDTRAGLIETATAAEASDGTDNSRAVTPFGLYPLVRPTTITNLNSHSFGDFTADAAATGSPDPAAGALWGRTFSNPTLSTLKFQLMGASATNKVYARFYNGTTFGTAKEIATSSSQLAARAWVKFNGTGTLNVNKSYNVSSVTDNGVGAYTINFTTPMDDISYAYAGMATSIGGTGVSAACVDQHPTNAPTVSALPIVVKASAGGAYNDAQGICVVVFD
ncbi:hypothetical protein [Pseudomonas ogarae]|uniref:hypothetical protein n=1 Tax=Pseudomonas ogarae (strain DSM 112162 / CECT 30235 / F113) TaxID=1114970 RepID=UPI001CED6873|nr:hypothetical protein [Pseudomonas zarinae]